MNILPLGTSFSLEICHSLDLLLNMSTSSKGLRRVNFSKNRETSIDQSCYVSFAILKIYLHTYLVKFAYLWVSLAIGIFITEKENILLSYF